MVQLLDVIISLHLFFRRRAKLDTSIIGIRSKFSRIVYLIIGLLCTLEEVPGRAVLFRFNLLLLRTLLCL